MSMPVETNWIQPSDTWPSKGRRLSRALFLVPLLGLIGLTAIFAPLLDRNPQDVPSALIGKPVPEFSLPPVMGRKLGLASTDLRGQASLVNFFASWCTACRAEHPLFMDLKSKGVVPIHGLDYKDRPEDAAKWLDELGDPYTRAGADRSGRVAIDWGVYGVPETFVVSAEGMILYKHIGPVTAQALSQTILPLISGRSDVRATGAHSNKQQR